MGPANHPADQGTEPAEENDCGSSCSMVGVGIGFRSKCRSQSEADYGADHSMASVAMVHPR